MTLEPIRLRNVGALRGAVATVVLVAILSTGAGATPSGPFAGKWYVQLPPEPPELVDISDVDGTVSFTFLGLDFYSLPFSYPDTALRAAATESSPTLCGTLLTAIQSGDALYGALSASSSPFDPYSCLFPNGARQPRYFTGHRCTCTDGNTVAGDGCDPSCRVEECFECTGDPSTCVPAVDGAACDDGSSCTTGETCSSGACTGGAPAPCIDLGGNWAFRIVTPLLEENGYPPAEVPAFLTQVNDSIELRFSPSSPAVYAGSIDPENRVFHLERSPLPHIVPCGADTFHGQTDGDGITLFALQDTHIAGIRCLAFPSEVTGSRCGTGKLAPPKQCDDGNTTSGDGCDSNCFVEPCFTCTGEPSVCSASDATPCDDGDPCTVGDVCEMGTCVAGQPLGCGPCLACTPDGMCEAAPRQDCEQPADAGRTLLALKSRGGEQGNEVAWSWQGGGATPSGSSAERAPDQDYTLCVYGASGPKPVLLFRATAPGGGICDDEPCWKSLSGRGSSYRNPGATPEGIRSLRMGWGRRGSARATLRGKGPMLSGRPYGFPHLPLAFPLRTQLQGENGICFEANFTGSASSGDDRAVKAFSAPVSKAP